MYGHIWLSQAVQQKLKACRIAVVLQFIFFNLILFFPIHFFKFKKRILHFSILNHLPITKTKERIITFGKPFLKYTWEILGYH